MGFDLLPLLQEKKIIAIIRGVEEKDIVPIAHALADGGIKFLEITMDTKGALEAICRLKETYGDRIKIGVGTVLNVDMAKEAVQAGAEFIVSPYLNENVVKYCVKQNTPVWPGTMTPTEIYRAYELGAKAVKIFPSGTLGARYIKEIKAPLNNVQMIVTGGINLENVSSYLKNGAIAVGVGGNLVDKHLVKQRDFSALQKRAEMFVERVKEVTEDE